MTCKQDALRRRSPSRSGRRVATTLGMLLAALLIVVPASTPALADDGWASRPITFPPAPTKPLNVHPGENESPLRSDEFGSNKAPLPAELEEVGVEEKLRSQVPLDLVFTDSSGQQVRLGDYIDGKEPVILNLAYYTCPMLCDQVWQGMVASMKQMDWAPGENFQIVTLSFDPQESTELAGKKKKTVIKELGNPEAAAGWHFLTGSAQNIERVAQAVGFNYHYLPDQRQYAHAAAIVILSPEGRVSRYLYGVKFEPETVRLSLAEASQGKVSSTLDRILLYCFHYDPETGKYTWAVMNLMRAGGVLTLIVLGVGIGFMTVRERRRHRGETAAPSSEQAGMSPPPDTSSEG